MIAISYFSKFLVAIDPASVDNLSRKKKTGLTVCLLALPATLREHRTYLRVFFQV